MSRSLPRTPMRRLIVLIVCVAVPVALWAALPARVDRGDPVPEQARRAEREDRPYARPDRPQEGRGEDAVERHRAVHAQDQPPAGRRSRRSPAAQEVLQRDLDAKRAELEQPPRRAALRARAPRPAASAACARPARCSPTRLVELFKADKPDILTVVLGSTDFADLLERTEFIRGSPTRTARSSARARAREGTPSTPRRTSRSSRPASRRSPRPCSARRDEIAAVKGELVGTRVGYAKTRAGKSAALSKVRERPPRAAGEPRGRWRRSRRRSPRSCASPRATRRRARSGRAPGSSSGRSTARSPACSASRARATCTPASTSRPARARRSAPPTPAGSCSCRASARRAATATSPACSTTRRRPRATRTSRASGRRWART